MKRSFAILLATFMVAGTLLSGCGKQETAASKPSSAAPSKSEASVVPSAPEEVTWEPTQDIDWIVTSKPGGGSDIYTRMISDIMTTEKMVNKTFLVNNKTDGGGEVGRMEVSQIKGKKADHTLLTFNSGDLMPMVKNTPNRIENFTPIAIMAVDKQLLFVNAEKAKYKDFKSILDALAEGKDVVMGGSKGDDIATYEALIEEIGANKDAFRFITHDGTGDAITALLGGHVDVLISKPAAASQYVESGKIIPILALSKERYSGNLKDAPTLSEIDSKYKNVEVPVWRGVVGPKDMSLEAAAYWSKKFEEVSDSQKWQEAYLDKNKLISAYTNLADTKAYMSTFETDYLKSLG